MPNMISLRKFRLASTSGHVVLFEAQKPTHVPPEAVQDAMTAGCVPCDEAGTPVYDDTSRKPVDFVGNVRQSLVYLMFDRLVKENNQRNFDSGNVPKADVISKHLGIELSVKDVRSLYESYQSAMASGEGFQPHPDAKAALDVLDATSKADLLLLANERGEPEEAIKGLSSRELRAYLLSKSSGLTSA